MTRLFRSTVVRSIASVCLAATMASIAWGAPDSSKQFRNWMVQDSIGVRYFSGVVSHASDWAIDAPNEVIQSSPDGRYFFFLTHRGVLVRDSNLYELAVYRTEDVVSNLADAHSRAPTLPFRFVAFESNSSLDPAINNPAWSSNGEAISFLGATGNELPQLYKLEVPSGTITRLTNVDRRISSYKQLDDSFFFYLNRTEKSSRNTYPSVWAERDSGGFAMQRFPIGVTERYRRDLYVGVGGGSPNKVDSEGLTVFSIAPGGKRAAAFQKRGGVGKFVWLDLHSGKVLPLLDAPVGPIGIRTNPNASGYDVSWAFMYGGMKWSADGQRLMLINTLLPDLKTSEGAGYIVEYEFDSGRWTVVAPMVEKVASDAQGLRFVKNVLAVTANRDVLVELKEVKKDKELEEHVLYRHQRGRWIRSVVSTSEARNIIARTVLASRGTSLSERGLSVRVRESANAPPTVIASNGAREIDLTGPDAALEGVWRAPIETVAWDEPDGSTQRGGLMLPRQVKPGVLPPLVIQIGAYLADRFLPDGTTSSGFAAQALASQGIAVLQIDGADYRKGTEGVQIVARIDAAVESLARKNLIDPRRVGLVGHSRQGYQTLYVLTHPGRTQLAAAVCLDFYTRTYMSYLWESAVSLGIEGSYEYEALAGGSFWQRKTQWLESEPTFNVDRVRTPVLMAHFGSQYSNRDRFAIDLLASFRLNRKPLEYFFVPTGDHRLVRPMERLSAMDAVTEWMRFWLKDELPVDPTRAAVLKTLRKQQDAVLYGELGTATVNSKVR